MDVIPAPQQDATLAEPRDGLARGLTREQQRALYESHFGFVWRNLRRLGVPEAVAEDAAQDVFLVVHRRQSSYDARWSRVETWLFGIVLRVARDHRRRLRRWRFRFDATRDATELAEQRTAGGDAPDEAMARREAAAELEGALDLLDDRKRAVLVMVDIEGFTVPEAAEALGVNVNTAYWRLRVGRSDFERALTRRRAIPAGRGGAS